VTPRGAIVLALDSTRSFTTKTIVAIDMNVKPGNAVGVAVALSHQTCEEPSVFSTRTLRRGPIPGVAVPALVDGTRRGTIEMS
jgi:hypothetical protein